MEQAVSSVISIYHGCSILCCCLKIQFFYQIDFSSNAQLYIYSYGENASSTFLNVFNCICIFKVV